MADIGAQLRETRMRNRIDISDVETHTKIRAKYLRALENEEWDLLPGQTFVVTFMRTYAEYLGMDARGLVEEYRRSAEAPTPHDTVQFGAARLRPQRQRTRSLVPGPWILILLGLIALAGGLYALGKLVGDQQATTEGRRSQATPAATESTTPAPTAAPAEKKPNRVRLQIIPTGEVSVCLKDSTGGALIANRTLAKGARTKIYEGRRFAVSFGTSTAVMRVDGKRYRVASNAPVSYLLEPQRKPRRLSDSRRPTCRS